MKIRTKGAIIGLVVHTTVYAMATLCCSIAGRHLGLGFWYATVLFLQTIYRPLSHPISAVAGRLNVLSPMFKDDETVVGVLTFVFGGVLAMFAGWLIGLLVERKKQKKENLA